MTSCDTSREHEYFNFIYNSHAEIFFKETQHPVYILSFFIFFLNISNITHNILKQKSFIGMIRLRISVLKAAIMRRFNNIPWGEAFPIFLSCDFSMCNTNIRYVSGSKKSAVSGRFWSSHRPVLVVIRWLFWTHPRNIYQCYIARHAVPSLGPQEHL